MEFSYVACGLGIRSALPLPELLPAPAAADVEIRRGTAPPPPPQAAASGYYFHATAEEAVLHWRDVGTFLVRGGRAILVDPVPGADETTLRLSLIGPALAVLLRQRGCLILHASAVVIGPIAVAFLGDSGWGKSTLAASLHGRGHRLLADDAVVVRVDGGRPAVLPGVPRISLWPESAAALAGDAERLPRLHPRFEKRTLLAGDGLPTSPVPLERIYVLAEGGAHAVEPLTPRQALLELIGHTYGALPLRSIDPAAQFRRCAAVAAAVPVFRLRIRRSLAALPQLARLVEDDAAGHAPRS